jgi:hypothetical protein
MYIILRSFDPDDRSAIDPEEDHRDGLASEKR